MSTSYRVWLNDDGETIDIEAEKFKIEEDGVLVFYEDDEGELTAGPEQFAAYKNWYSVLRV